MERINPTTPASAQTEDFKTRAANGHDFPLTHVRGETTFKKWSVAAHGAAAIAEVTPMFRPDYCMRVEGQDNDVIKLDQDTRAKRKKIVVELRKALRWVRDDRRVREERKTQRHSERVVKGSLSEGGSGRYRKRPIPSPPASMPMSSWNSDQDGPPALEPLSAD